MMRFDEFLKKHGTRFSPVDRFAGFLVEVGLPPGWEPFESAVGVRVWVCRTDPQITVFCANAVLTMHRVEAPIDAGEVFAMLVEQQLQSVPGSRERHRELAAAAEGRGVVGALATEISHELGAIESVSRSRIVPAEREILIAQLTVTALKNSPVERAGVWLSVRTGAAALPARGGDCSAVTVAERGTAVHGE